ncbi:MAG: mannose-6-phosphate isomerase [Acholeplasmatales bacterium]|nr:MAG: mannose-6-phosphate isomerase [Acholeplasmatales bacterium]
MPIIDFSHESGRVSEGFDAVVETLSKLTGTIVVETYPGVDMSQLESMLRIAYPDHHWLNVETFAFDRATLDARFADYLTDDRVFGVMCPLTVNDLYPASAQTDIIQVLKECKRPTVLYGFGAAHFIKADVLVYVELHRWAIQQKYRQKTYANWQGEDHTEDLLKKYKRGFFIEWRIADKHKQTLIEKVDVYVDTSTAATPRAIAGDLWREALRLTTQRPFRLVPYFDPGVWGGQWMKEVCGLDRAARNYAWAFDGVPEENHLRFKFRGGVIDTPAINVVFAQPVALLGDHVHARFGKEFPIRFDFLDTMGGGNLSLQVHPFTEYIKDTFGMAYTQDESYYILDAGAEGTVWLGLKTGVDQAHLVADLHAAQRGEKPFPAEAYVNVYPAKKHDHISIPAGTIHCSGKDVMVLEISATPYIFTFKMWDWGRLGLDGLPRPIHLDHALKNIDWSRDSAWVEKHLLNPFTTLHETPQTIIERTGLHPTRQFIETHRHTSTEAVDHETHGSVNMLNLVEGVEATVSSMTDAFEPFIVHYAETFIIPAALTHYRITPSGPSHGQAITTIKAFVRR